jgi:hypothetical protein
LRQRIAISIVLSCTTWGFAQSVSGQNAASTETAGVEASTAAQKVISDEGEIRPSLKPFAVSKDYAWTQSPSDLDASGIKAGPNTLMLKPCPLGVNGKDKWHYVYISGSGIPEAALITGGTCTSGAPTGTIQVSLNHAHPRGFLISSATGGVQEAVIDAALPASNGQVARNVLVSPGYYVFYARLSIRATGLTITATGSVVTCMMSDTCIMLGDPENSNLFRRITLQGLNLRPGVPKGTWTAIEDDAQGSKISDVSSAPNADKTSSFGYLIQVDNDQAAVIDRLDTTLRWARCDKDFCSSAIYGPGPFSKYAGIMWIQNSNLSLQCGGNGIDNRNGNTLMVRDTVVQGYPQFGVRSVGLYSNNPSVELDNVYQEIGGCSNPLGTGITGLLASNGYVRVAGGEGPAGQFPQFANTGAISYVYYVVAHSSELGVSPPLLAGYAKSNGHDPIKVKWNRVGKRGTISYDVLRVVGDINSANTGSPFGSGEFAITKGLSSDSCDTLVCSFMDHPDIAPSQYSLDRAAVYSPALSLWPGSVVLTTNGDSANSGGLVPPRYYADKTTGGIISSVSPLQPIVFAQECDPGSQWSGIWMECVGGSSVSNNYPPVVGTVLQLSSVTGSPGRLKGRLIFELPPESSVAGTHVITLSDSNPEKTIATPNNRPSWDTADAYIGYDQPSNVNRIKTQLSLGAPVSISGYIDNVGDGVNWLERLTSTGKTFKVPVSADGYRTNSNCASVAGECGTASAGRVVIPTGQTVTNVSTTAVDANSEISLTENFSYGPSLGVQCNKTLVRHYAVLNQTAGVGFTIATDKAPLGAPACLSFSIFNPKLKNGPDER